MCGRFTQTASPQAIAQQFGITTPPLFTPRYNIAPSQPIAAIRIDLDTTTRTLVMLRWGLIPSWAKDSRIGNQCINAKAETVAEKPAFRSSFSRRRCLVIADGFYEWKPELQHKQPYYISVNDRRPCAFAGLWARWEPPAGRGETGGAAIRSHCPRPAARSRGDPWAACYPSPARGAWSSRWWA